MIFLLGNILAGVCLLIIGAWFVAGLAVLLASELPKRKGK